MLADARKTKLADDLIRCHLEKVNVRTGNLEAEMVRLVDQQCKFTSALENIIKDSIESSIGKYITELMDNIRGEIQTNIANAQAIAPPQPTNVAITLRKGI